VSVEEKSYLRTALLGCLVVAAVVLTVNTSSQGAKVRPFPARTASPQEACRKCSTKQSGKNT
jgi:hypothetical protein